MIEILLAFIIGYLARCAMHIYAKQLRKFKRKCITDAKRDAVKHYIEHMRNYGI